MTITIVGLGPGPVDALSLKAWRTLENAQTVYLRTQYHACVPELPSAPVYHNFDALNESPDTVAANITQQLLQAADSGDVIYAVPGDPLVGESTVLHLRETAETAGVSVEIINGISFIEPVLALLKRDALDGLQILDGVEVAAMYHPPINPDTPALIGQVYHAALAANIKQTLLNQYPAEFVVQLIHNAASPDALVESLPLVEMDRSEHINPLTALYVPALGSYSSFEAFQEIIAHLRSPEGCPWDRKQTHESLRPYLLEETYEVLEALDAGDTDALYAEMGDLMLQIVLHTQIAIDNGEFNMTHVMRNINEKMIRRHPHVWGDVDVEGNPNKVVANWEQIKQQEKADNGVKHESILDSVPKIMPALMLSHKYQAKAAKVGFDWPDVGGVEDKIREELAEVFEASTPEAKLEEIGDLMFVLVNWMRWLGSDDPESVLRETAAKFYRRFHYVEDMARERGDDLESYTLAQMDALWDEAKTHGL